MATRIAYVPRYTVENLEQWEDRWELIDGLPYAMSPAPKILHQRINGRIHTLLEEALAGCPQCQALLTVNYRIDDETLLIPDNLVVCTEEVLDGVYLTTTPSLVVEIVSPSTAAKDRRIKYDLYEAEGVRHYVIVDPDAERADGFVLDGDRYARQFESRDDTVAFDLGPCSFTLDLGRLWRR
jgi:Uma2 family endonuclease